MRTTTFNPATHRRLIAAFSAACCLGLAAGVAAASPVVAAGSGEGISTDVFDVSQGTLVTSNSPLVAAGSQASNAIGGSGGIEGPHTLFADGGTIGQTDFIEFRTPAPITLTGYSALLADDSDSGNSPNRGSTTFRLYRTFGPSLPAFQLLSEATLSSPYATVYGSNVVRITDTFQPVTSEFYRIEVVRATAGGPRIREVDAVGTIPEPVAPPLIAAAAAAAAALRRSPPRARPAR